MNLYLLNGGHAGELIAAAQYGDDLITESVPTSGLVALLAFAVRLRTAAEGKGQRPAENEMRQFAEQLYDFAIRGQVRDVFRRPTSPLSLQLLSNHAAVEELPWEYMIIPNAPLAPDRTRRVVRLMETNGWQAPKVKKLGSKIRVLYAFADPVDQPDVPWKVIHDQIKQQFASLMQVGTFEIEVIEGANYAALQTALDPSKKTDVFHFNGHGLLKKDAQGNMAGYLALRSVSGVTEEVSADQIAALLRGCNIPLAVLSACNTSAGNATDAHGIIAKALVNGGGVSAVVANQFSVSTKVAASFASKLYEVLLTKGNIDEAVTEGRLALNGMPGLGQTANIEWGIPTLYRQINSAQLYQQ